MNNKLFFPIKKQTDTLIDQTKPKQQETLELKLKMDFSSFSPPLNFSDDADRLLPVANFEATNSLFDINFRKNSSSNFKPHQ